MSGEGIRHASKITNKNHSQNHTKKSKVRDYSKFNKNNFLLELENLNLQNISQQSSDCNLVNK
jgi:hypothetical protein